MSTLVFGFGMPGPTETIVIGIIMLLLFGRRLPEVGRSLGQSIIQFKKGLKDVQDEMTEATDTAEPKKFDSVKAPLNSGEDQRVSQADSKSTVEEPVPEVGDKI